MRGRVQHVGSYLRLSLRKKQDANHMIVCICRGVSDRTINRAIDDGARTIADLKACGIGDCCGGCHGSLRTMLAQAAEARAVEAIPCPACDGVTSIVAAVSA